MNVSLYFVIFFMFATLTALVAGLVTMASGGKFNKKYSSFFMMTRVAMQATVLTMLIVMLVSS